MLRAAPGPTRPVFSLPLALVANRFGQTRIGRAVLRGPCGWVLNMGGPHGTPAVATEETIEQVQPQGSKAIGHWRRSSLMTTDKAATAIGDRRGGDQDGDDHLGHDRPW